VCWRCLLPHGQLVRWSGGRAAPAGGCAGWACRRKPTKRAPAGAAPRPTWPRRGAGTRCRGRRQRAAPGATVRWRWPTAAHRRRLRVERPGGGVSQHRWGTRRTGWGPRRRSPGTSTHDGSWDSGAHRAALAATARSIPSGSSTGRCCASYPGP